MRGEDIQQNELFSYGSLEERIPASHPLRPIRTMVDEALKQMNERFDATLYLFRNLRGGDPEFAERIVRFWSGDPKRTNCEALLKTPA